MLMAERGQTRSLDFSSLEASQCPNFSADFIIFSQHYHYWSMFSDSFSPWVTSTLPAEKAYHRSLLVNNWLFVTQPPVRTCLAFFWSRKGFPSLLYLLCLPTKILVKKQFFRNQEKYTVLIKNFTRDVTASCFI